MMIGETTSPTQRSGVRDEMLHAAVALLDAHGPDALQTRKVAGATGTSTMAVYTHFGGMPELIAEVADEACDSSTPRSRCHHPMTQWPIWWPPAPPIAGTPSSARTCIG